MRTESIMKNKDMGEKYGVELLAVGAHPDDVELSCGGTLLAAKARGQSVGIVDFTLGELSSRGNLETRALETQRASSALGLNLRENLNFPDGGINGFNDNVQLETVVKMLRRLRPEILLLPYRAERHPDHVATSHLCTRACFLAGLSKFLPGSAPFRPRQVIYYQMRYEFRPTFLVDITAFQAKKMEAIRAYATQVGLDASKGDAPTLVGSGLSLSSLEARDRHLGAMIGVEFAEGFVTYNALSIKDPVEHFRNGSGQDALFYPEPL